jgi:hypothetical protein
MVSVDRLDPGQATAVLAGQLKSRGPVAALRTALIAEHIRTLTWAAYFRTSDQHPIHTARMFAGLNRNLASVAAEAFGLRDALTSPHKEYELVRGQLENCGDIVHLGGGYWIPGPLRVVHPATSEGSIVVGGVPTTILEQQLKAECQCIGAVRYVPKAENLGTPHTTETAAEWLGVTEPLRVWTHKISEWASAQLQPQAYIEDSSLEIYAPDAHGSGRGLGFWAAANEFREPAPTLRLFRPRTAQRWAFDRPDYLGIFISGMTGARLARAVQIPRDTAVRVQFGFDQKLETPRTITLKKTESGCCLDLKFALPSPESRVLSLGKR